MDEKPESVRPFEEQVAFVTGAGRGIGRAIVELLAERGATVVVSDVDGENAQEVVRGIAERGGTALPLTLDVTDAEAVRSSMERVYKAHGRLDIVVNNAGILASTPIVDITVDEWQQILDVNVNGVFYCCQAALRIMSKQGNGRIINIASIAGRSVSDIGGAHYTTSKAAVLGLTRHMAKEAGPRIRVNSVCPGMIDTPMNETFGSPEKTEEVCSQLALQRIGRPREVAAVVAFLASEDAAYVTGETVEVDGGALMI
jgi:NAD(P)-dependent dehydrogenase (short-subunit alcohol dehydrogenase family)